MKFTITANTVLSSLAVLGATSVSPRQASHGAATIDLSKNTGPAQVLASGWIYGWPDNGIQADSSISENLVRDIKFNANRAGGAQISARGWFQSGYTSYLPRLNSALSNYRTTRKYGGSFILLIHDLWGADGSNIPKYPGDNGNWTDTDAFLEKVANDLTTNEMLEGLVLDLWNEPDLTIFWNRSWDQFLQYYTHAHTFFQKKLPNTLISGPSMAHSPTLNNDKWIAWLKMISNNKTIPNIYSWHQIGSWEREPDSTLPDLNRMKASFGLPDRPIDINEYASKEEQNPANSVYYIAQLERNNMRGLRANWASGSGLHNYMGGLIYKRNSGYYPNGEWQLYKYYAAMQGTRVATTPSPDHRFDVFATKTGNMTKILAGTRSVKAPYEIKISGLGSVGLSEKGYVTVQVYRFDWAGDQGEVKAPVNLGSSSLAYSSGTVSLNQFRTRFLGLTEVAGSLHCLG